MAGRKRRRFSAEFKARVVRAAMREDKTLAALAGEFDIHPNQITEWKRQEQFSGGRSIGTYDPVNDRLEGDPAFIVFALRPVRRGPAFRRPLVQRAAGQ